MKTATVAPSAIPAYDLSGDLGPEVDALLHGLERFRLLSPRQTAALLGLSEATLERLPDGPTRVLLSPRRVGYPLQGVLSWIAQRPAAAGEAA